MTSQPPIAAPLRLPYDAGASQFGELTLPAVPAVPAVPAASVSAPSAGYPVAMLIHGGYWRARYGLDQLRVLAQDLARRGIAAWNIEYRRVGEPGGGWPGTLLDVARAADYLAALAPTYHLDLSRVVAIGHSAGGHLAFWLAARRRIPAASPLAPAAPHAPPQPLAGAISLAGVLDLALAYQLHLSNDAVVALLGGTPDAVPERYAAASPAALLPLGVPQVVIHGIDDADVPLQVSREYVAAARALGEAINDVEMADTDHFDLITPESAAWARTLESLDMLIRRAEQEGG